jgi:hypothetical protein
MEKRLFRVNVVLYVMAEDEADACAAATQVRFDIFECVARKAAYVDPAWEDAVPYNADDERTCSQVMTAIRPGVHPKSPKNKIPEYVKTGIRDFNERNQSIQTVQQP